MNYPKADLRSELKARRRELSAREVEAASQKIGQRVLEILNKSSISTLHTYLPIASQNEVDTRLILEDIWSKQPDIRTASWKKTDNEYEIVWINEQGLGGPVPAGQQFDAILVPMLGFNSSLHRLGFGGGHYDRFLASQKKAFKIGLCCDFGRVDFAPEPHDIAMDIIVTEKEIYQS